jgi:5'-methylthioadenosine phosphorylase
MIAIIGGSGLYDFQGLENKEEIELHSEFGEPSDNAIQGQIAGKSFVFLPRHGRHHALNPSEINYRANIESLKRIGVTRIIAISAVGSLKEKHFPGKFLIPDQYIDKTYKRNNTYFEGGCVAHVSFGEPVCSELSESISQSMNEINIDHSNKGTYICIEGPQFSTKAESELYRSWGCDIIGMTNMPEAKLAREAGICYSSVSMVTDYDCWHSDHDSVTVDSIIKTMSANKEKVQNLLLHLPKNLSSENSCKSCANNNLESVMTNQEYLDSTITQKLQYILKN